MTVAALLLVHPGSSRAADGREFEGGGLATIVAGNVVSAKQRAVQRAQRDLLEQALHLLIDDAQRLRLASRIEATVFARPALFLRGYRLVHEEQFEDVFSVRVAARCDLARLRAAVLPGTGSGTSSEGQRVALTVDLRLAASDAELVAVLRSRARALVRSRAERAGFVVQFGSAITGSGSATKSAPPTAGVSLQVQLDLSAAPEVRGLGWYAAQATVTVAARAGVASIGSWDSVQWASEPASWQGAAARALDRALVAALGPCIAALGQKREGGRDHGPAAHRITIEGASGMATVLSLCGWVRDRGLGSCRLDRLARGAVDVEIRGRATTEGLASALERADLEGTDLEVVGRGWRSLRVRARERVRPQPGDGAGGSSDEATGDGPQ